MKARLLQQRTNAHVEIQQADGGVNAERCTGARLYPLTSLPSCRGSGRYFSMNLSMSPSSSARQGRDIPAVLSPSPPTSTPPPREASQSLVSSSYTRVSIPPLLTNRSRQVLRATPTPTPTPTPPQPVIKSTAAPCAATAGGGW